MGVAVDVALDFSMAISVWAILGLAVVPWHAVALAVGLAVDLAAGGTVVARGACRGPCRG